MGPSTQHQTSQIDTTHPQETRPFPNMQPATIPWSPTIPQNIDIGYLLSVIPDANKEGLPGEERSIAPAHVSNLPGRKSQAKICQNWYHGGTCKQHEKSACPFVHRVEPTLPMAKLPIGLKKKHKQGCGFARCPLRDGKPNIAVSPASPPQPAKQAAQP